MTPDELPADMEGRLTEALNDVERIGMTHKDVRIAVPLFDAVNRTRALLKAYQEQRRALEVISKGGPDTNRPPRPKFTDGFDEGCAWAGRIARRALNQKGDER